MDGTLGMQMRFDLGQDETDLVLLKLEQGSLVELD